MEIDMSNCLGYIQLFISWLVLNLSTLSLGLVTDSARFFGLSDSLQDASDNVSVFGVWVLSEIGLFLLLLVVATAIMCTCKNIPSGAGFIHLLVDPSLVTLGCIPFLLIKGLPTANALFACLHNYNISSSPPRECYSTELGFFPNITHEIGNPWTRPYFIHKMNSWVGSLQCMLLVPVCIRMLRFRWKMAWIPFLLSQLYFFIQAAEIGLLIQTGAEYTSDESLQLAIEALAYISALYICIACLAMATPPCFVGNHISNDFLKASLIIGTLIVDIPFLIARVALVTRHGHATWWSLELNPMTYVMVVKDVVSSVGLLCFVVKTSTCVQTQYLTLSGTDAEDDDDLDDSQEDFV